MKIEICACFINYSIKSCLSLEVESFLLACSSARRLRKNSISSGEWKLQKEPSSLWNCMSTPSVCCEQRELGQTLQNWEENCHRTRRSDAKGKSICLWIKFWTFNLLVQCLDQNRITSRYSCPAEAFEMIDFAAGFFTANNQMAIFVTTEAEILCSSSLFPFSLPFLICTSFAGYDILRLRNDKYAMLPILWKIDARN